MLFFRASADGTTTDATATLENLYGGTDPTACWLVGSGPSLLAAPTEKIAASSAVKIGVNFSGRGPDGTPPRLIPDIWTSFDPTPRFHKSVFLNPRIIKFLKSDKIKDLVPGTTVKACDCPATYFFRNEHRGYSDFLKPSSDRILNALDSFLQAFDIGFRLGFRTFFCVGTELIIRPSEAQIELARSRGVDYSETEGVLVKRDNVPEFRSDRLSDFVDECVRAFGNNDRKATIEKLQACRRESQYSFSENKPLAAAINADGHYWERVQYLRLARRCLSLHGVRLISCTPGSRLNAWFPYRSATDVCFDLRSRCGAEDLEQTVGRYSGETGPERSSLPFHKDVQPYGWDKPKPPPTKPGDCGCKEAAVAPAGEQEIVIPPKPVDRAELALEKFKGLVAGQAAVEINEVH
ncbi:MAG: hypothetical protein IT428_17195 [Planctomycetaceae bacterium]|nr:hypothetical protein [Planctomycetaceae bacterium]